MEPPSAPDRALTLRTVIFATLAVLTLVLFITAPIPALREEGSGSWGELYRRAGDAYTDLAYLTVSAGPRPDVTEGFLQGARSYYARSAKVNPADAKASLSRALAEYISRGGEARGRALLAEAVKHERRERERAQMRAVLLAFPAGRPELGRLEIAEEIIAPLAPGPWALSNAYQRRSEAEPASRLWDVGWNRAKQVLPRVVAMLVVCGLILLVGAVGLLLFLASLLGRRAVGPRTTPPIATWGLREALEALLLFVVLQFVFGMLTAAAPRGAESFLFLLPSVLAAGVAISWIRLMSPPPGQLGWRLDHPWRRFLTGVAAGGVIVLPASLLGLCSQTVLGLPPEEHPLAPILATARSWLGGLFLIVGACGIIPVLEETLFRGVWYGALRRHTSAAAAIAASAVVFAAGHLSMAGFLPYLLVGAMLAWAYERSGSLLVSAAAHGAFNAFNIAMLMVLFR